MSTEIEDLIAALPDPANAGKASMAIVAAILKDVCIPLSDCIRLREACLKSTDAVLVVGTASLVALYGDSENSAWLAEAEGILTHVLSLPNMCPVYIARRVGQIRGSIERLRDLA